MAIVSLSSPRLALAILVGAVLAKSQFTPLVNKRFSYPSGIPYKVDTDDLIRGRQTGYNRCNSTTEGQDSLCQTSFINSIDDFCLWAPIEPNSVVGDVEGEMVAWCTKPGRGTRLIPADALQGVQFMETPDYVQVVGFIDQTKINIQAGDSGGEMDPHGADLRGNPLGGLLYSTSWGGSFKQVIEWHNFIGNDFFCLKACDPAGRNAAKFCEHIFDRIGCAYNAPNNAQKGIYESCSGENQDFPGHYVVNGATVTYKQPPESLGAISSMPYVARVPASSNCAQFTSSVLYAAGASITAPDATTTGPDATAAPTGAESSTSPTSLITDTQTGGGTTQVQPTGTSAGAGSETSGGPEPAQPSNEAGVLVISGAATVLGVIFSALFLS